MEALISSVRGLNQRRLLWLLGLAALALALVLGWEWLTAIGLASVILSVLPCLAMCALGICMNKRPGSSCEIQPGSSRAPGETEAGKQ